jgi:hypothetical protein
MFGRFWMRWALAAFVAGCLLAGCDDDPKPDLPDPTPSVSSTAPTEASTSPTVTPSTVSDPVDTVKTWVAAQNHGLETGDTAPLRALSAEGCRGCDDFPDGIDGILQAGGSFKGGKWTLVRAKVEDGDVRPLRVNVAVHIAGGTTISASGATPNTYPPANRLFVFELVDDTGAWLISLIGSLS